MFELPIELIVFFTVLLTIIVFLAALFIFIRFYIKVPPSKVAVISGSRHELIDGTVVGYRLITGGATLVKPFFEKVDYLDLNLKQILIQIKNADTVNDIPVSVKATANVKIKKDAESLHLAVENFLGVSDDEFQQIISQITGKHLRTILRAFTFEEINSNNDAIAQELLIEADEEIKKTGIIFDAFTIQEVRKEEIVEKLSTIGKA